MPSPAISTTARGWDNAALIVAHGSPSSPAGPEAVLRRLGQAVEARLPGWAVRGTTLATTNGIRDAVEELAGRAPLLVYPLFMADGWFVTSELPRRLDRGGARGHMVLPPLGLDPRLHHLALRRAKSAARRQGDGAETAVLLAAHGSPSDPRPARAARVAAEVLSRFGGFREVRTGFVDEAPFIADVARGMGQAICLPFFATVAGHVRLDVPEALASAEFAGEVLPPIGADPLLPPLIARALACAEVRGSAGVSALP